MVRLILAALGLIVLGCGDDGGSAGDDDVSPDAADTLPTAPPTGLRAVATEGFQTPSDAVASPDGKTFYFAALTTGGDEPPQPALFQVPAAGGVPTALHTGAPLAYVTGLVLSCDGATLYVADMGLDGDADGGALYAVPTAGGAPTAVTAGAIAVPSGLAMDRDCATLVVTGRDAEGQGALFRVGIAGGAVHTVRAGTPLMSPSGVHVDARGVSWVMDLLAGDGGSGALFAIAEDGGAELRGDNLLLGTPGGVSLVAGGGTAVIGARDRATGDGALLTIDLASGTTTSLTGGGLVEAAGLRTARSAGVFAVADGEGNAILAAE
jgi:DNA-binding beta-propeller fold protein YncE